MPRTTLKPRADDRLPLLRQCRGTAATEFALVLPLMVLIGVGCLDVGRAVQHYGVMSNAVSAGAQRGATTRFFAPYTRVAWEAKVREAVRDELASLTTTGTPMAAFDIRIETEERSPGVTGIQTQPLPRIRVAVDYDFPTTLAWPGLPRFIPLHCESVIRQYR